MKDINKIRLIVLLSGFISMELELLGTRLLAPVFGSTIYVWTSLIGITLTFLALGYWYGGKLADEKKINLNKLGLIIFSLGIYISFLPFLSDLILRYLINWGIIFGPLAVSMIILAFPIFFLGFIVPTSVKFATDNMGDIGERSGEIYALATVGSVIGTFATGFFLILYLGIFKTALITGIVLILLSLITFKRKKFLIFLIIPFFLFFMIPKAPAAVVYSNSGFYSDLKVMSEVIGGYNVTQLISNNLVQTIKTNDPNYFSYINFFKIPFRLRDNISSVLMIGLGGGEGAKMIHDDYHAQVDVVDLDPRMETIASDYFGFNASEYNITINDARNYLSTTDKKYDLIISDVAFVDWSPYIFTTNFYKIAKNHLNENGIFMINMVTPKEGENSILAKSVYSDLKKNFNDVEIFRNPRTSDEEIDNTFFVASDEKIFAKNMVFTNLNSIDLIMQNAFTYNETLNSEDTDDFVPIERNSLNIRKIYFDESKEDIQKLNFGN
jgi:spermidine synthase